MAALVGVERVSLDQVYRHDERAYCELVAELGRQNSTSLFWWASTIAGRTVSAESCWPRLRGFLDHGQPVPSVWPTELVRAVAAQLYRIRLMAPPALRRRLADAEAPARIFITYLDRRAFGAAGDDYHDPYWGQLPLAAAAAGSCWIVGKTSNDEHAVRDRLTSRAPVASPQIWPIEAFLRPADVLLAAARTVTAKVHFGEALFRGRPVRRFLRRQLRWERWSGLIFRELCLHRALDNLLRRAQPPRIYWPWENHSWEKLLVLARNRSAPETITIGYQHNTVPLFALNHFPAAAEHAFAPAPDWLVTTGPEPRRQLIEYAGFPAESVTSGCGIRYDYLHHLSVTNGPLQRPLRLGLPLSAYPEINSQMLTLVAAAEPHGTVVIRPHPLIPEDRVRRHWHAPWPENFAFSTAGSMADFMAAVDVVLYNGSSVCCEAAMAGIAAVYLDIGDGPSGDRMIDNHHLKWQACSPAQLTGVLQQITALPDDELARQRRQARAYMMSYFAPVTPASLQELLTLGSRCA